MNLTPEKQQRVSMMFDSYIKKCCKNKLCNIENRINRMEEKEYLLLEELKIQVETNATGLTIPDYIVQGYEIEISNESLLKALEMLEPNERELILLLFFIGHRPKDVSSDLKIGERAVYKRKNKILVKLKKFMEEQS